MEGLNQYLGCFIDHIDNRDFEIFIGDYQHLTSIQCIFACQKQNYRYAAIQNGNECRCGNDYGKYGQVLDDECNYSCVTSEKCGGNKRNSVYNVNNSIDMSKTDLPCLNTMVGYQGCFDSVMLDVVMGVVKSIRECISHCEMYYYYAGIMNGYLCHCGNELNLPSVNSVVCNIPCNRSVNAMTIDCCGGLHTFSVYNTKNYR
ncbi:unnamed protein product [Rotaria sp. Silwood1]|nr:unnamed protein product [Rotaria sp. Silwood1]